MTDPKSKYKDPNKNPYSTETPEWKLWENMKSNESLANTFANEAEAALKKSSIAREKANRFKDALIKLTGVELTIVKTVDVNAQITVRKEDVLELSSGKTEG